MASGDPFHWTSEEVSQFFRHCIPQFISDNGIRGVKLPDTHLLAQQLHENDLNGRDLLELVDMRLLLNEIGITSLKQRLSIVHIILALRKASSAYAENNATTRSVSIPFLPTPHASVPQTPTAPSADVHLIGTKTRRNEVLLEDASGRKRRKLNLTAPGDVQLGATKIPPDPDSIMSDVTSANQHASIHGYLRDEKFPVDELFYGDSPYGHEIRPSGTVNDNDEEYENFSFVAEPAFAGTSIFVYNRLRHSFQHQDTREITYHRRPALALHPYPDSVVNDKDSRSVTVFQIGEGENDVKAFREKSLTLSYQNDETVDVQADPGTEWSFLLQKYSRAENEELLPTYGESESGNYTTPTEEQTESVSGTADDDMAEEEAQVEEVVFDKDLAPAVVDRVIESQTQTWHATKLPKLEKARAWRTWRMAKGKRPVIKGLTQQARKVIAQLNSRLERMKKDLAERTWDNELELEQACEIMEPTVYDRKMQEWNILTWARKGEPPHEVKAGKQSDTARPGLVVELPSQAEPDGDDDDMQEFIENDEFQDAQETISSDPESDRDSVLDLARDEDTAMQVDEPSTNSDDEMAEVPEAFGEDPPADDSDDEMADLPDGFDHNDRDEPRQPSSPPEIATDEEPLRTPRDSRFLVPPLDPDSDDLPSPSFLKLRSSQIQSEKKKKKKQKKKIEIIELSSDPVAPSPLKASQRPVKRETVKYSDDPDKDPVRSIPTWNYDELEDLQDRRRLILKLAFDMTDKARKDLLPFLTGNMTTCIQNIKLALVCLREGDEEYPGHCYEESEAMRYAARLYNCWVLIDHTLFNAEVERFSGSESELPFDNEQDFDDDLRNWHANAKRALQKVEAFSKSEQANVIITIDDDELDDEEEEMGQSSITPFKKRKRLVQESQPALNMRAKALERASKAGSQTNGSLILAQMLDDGNITPENVPIYAPDDVDSSKHIYLNPEIAKRLKSHQIEGIRFMFREITASKEDDGQGCLLAHTMGLGKTAQSIALILTIAETAHSDEKKKVLPKDLRKKKLRVLVLCPPTLLQNWRQEIKIWVPPGQQGQEGVLGETYCIDASNSTRTSRIDDVKNWYAYGGILLCGYNMFSRVVNMKAGKSQGYTEDDLELLRNMVLDKPHIVIADEAHSIKNEKSSMSMAAHKIVTHRRIGLTGSPMSNNTQEIYALVNWVAPGFLGTLVEFNANYAEPIVNGTFVDSPRASVRLSLKKLAALKQIIAPKLNRADITVLKGSIKSKVEFVLTVPLTKEQQLPYEKYVELVLKNKSVDQGTAITQVKFFGWLAILQLLCNHPETFKKKLKQDPKDPKLLALKASMTKKKKKVSLPNADATPGPSTAVRASGSPGADEDDVVPGDEHVSKYDIGDTDVQQLLACLPEKADIELSHKTFLVRQIIELSIAAGDKVLLFSHSIPSLDFLNVMLKDLGLRYSLITGSMDQPKRQRVLAEMQKGELDVLLVSTRAGGLGLNIQEANRVIIFDFGFNPTWEEQAVGRAYRLGQTKPVFVYRFVAGGTFEWQLYDKQIFKTGLSSRVVDKKNPVRNAVKKPSEWMYPPQPVPQGDIHSEAGKDPHVMDKIIAGHENGKDSYVRGIKTMETLMEDAKDEALTEEEMLEVQNDIALAASRFRNKGFDARITLAPPPSGNRRPPVAMPGAMPGTPTPGTMLGTTPGIRLGTTPGIRLGTTPGVMPETPMPPGTAQSSVQGEFNREPPPTTPNGPTRIQGRF